MRLVRSILCNLLGGLFIGMLLCVSMTPARAKPTFVPVVSPGAQRSFVPIAAQLQTLLGSSPPAVAPSLSTPNTVPSPSKNDDSEDTTTEQPQDTFGTRALDLLLNDFDLLRTESKDFVENFSAGTDLSLWFAIQNSDQRHIDRWHSIGQDFLSVVVSTFIAAALLELLLFPLRRLLLQRRPERLPARLTTILLLIGTKLLPPLLFVGVSLTLLDHVETQKLQRFVILNIIYAVTVGYLALIAIRIILAPRYDAFRFLPISNDQAQSAYRWLASFSIVIIYGYFFVDLARAIFVPVSVINLLNHILETVLVVMAIFLIVEKRRGMASFLRGSLSAAQPDLSPWQNLRLWFARSWHILAIAYLIVGFSITLLNVRNGFNLLLRGTILTLLTIILLRFIFMALERWSYTASKDDIAIHRLFLAFVLRGVAWILAVLIVIASWGADIPALFATPLGQRFLGAALSIGATIAIVTIIYEALHTACERHLHRRDEEGKPIPASSRMRTLLPMLRNTALIVFAAIIVLVVLSEAGINIGPLLAGAGVLGVAIGFGSQTLVKDFLTGLFIIVENTIAIGDVIKIGDHSGVVDAMSLRTLRLRDNDGALHILPFSEVSQIVNMTKDYAFAVIDVGVSYNCDLEHVMAVLRSVGDDLQQDPIFKRVILEPIEILGIEKLGDSSITLRARLRTRPGKQWDVKRMFLLKMKQRFDKEGIDIPYPITTQIQIAGKTPE